ncbi:unnamed protein product [Parnassius apollo]|uniref:(apollo) hypothetical protein n=1 Tax=Parnassius apollo TaxID=110799 RepID=A0A8S3W3N8_PARAO|nr:unnamed protein product [Parnassius apollo]
MDSRGRFMVKMCQKKEDSAVDKNKTIKQQDQSTIIVSPQKHNVITCQKLPSEMNKNVCDDINFAVDITIEKMPDALLVTDVPKLPEHDGFKIITCESAPASIMASEMITNNINQPQSAPMPINSDSEDETGNIITTRAIIETPIDQVSPVNRDRRIMEHNITIAETTESEKGTGNKEKEICRWKNTNQTNWKRNKELEKKRKCLPYKSKTGKFLAAKLPKIVARNAQKSLHKTSVRKLANPIGLYKILS